MVFQMPPHIAGQPIGVRDQETQSELVVGEVHGVETSVDHGDALEGHLGKSIGHVQIVQDACRVAGFDQDEIAVVLGAVVGVLGDDGRKSDSMVA
jgi:hypothetical protein